MKRGDTYAKCRGKDRLGVWSELVLVMVLREIAIVNHVCGVEAG